jgi:mycothiol system anti-sigma-R factor
VENSEADCRAILERLYLWIDGEIAGIECSQIEVHVRDCADCLQHAEFERAVKLVVKRKCGNERLPDGFVERLQRLF